MLIIRIIRIMITNYNNNRKNTYLHILLLIIIGLKLYISPKQFPDAIFLIDTHKHTHPHTH